MTAAQPLAPPPQRLPARAQRGVAAIEFAFVMTALVLLLYGLATFGTALYTQQALARATEDGARAALMQPGFLTANPAELVAAESNVLGAVHDALARSLIVPGPGAGSEPARRAWVQSHVTVTVEHDIPAASTVTIRVSYPYRHAGNPFPNVPLLDASTWLPDVLDSHATAALAI